MVFIGINVSAPFLASVAKTGRAPGVVPPTERGKPGDAPILDLLDPKTRDRVEKEREETGALIAQLKSGPKKGDGRDRVAEVREKLKLLRLQAQIAAATGDRKAAARIAKEAARLSRELAQAAREAGQAGTPSADVAVPKSEALAAAGAASATAGPAATPDPKAAGREQDARREFLAAAGAEIAQRGGAAKERLEFTKTLRGLLSELRSVFDQVDGILRRGRKRPEEQSELDAAKRDFARAATAVETATAVPVATLPTAALLQPLQAPVDIVV